MQARREGGELVLSVADEGPGFPADFIDGAFERFSRADASRKRGGAGLGLAIARAVARAHGGDAAIESTRGSSVVAVRLPAAAWSLPRLPRDAA